MKRRYSMLFDKPLPDVLWQLVQDYDSKHREQFDRVLRQLLRQQCSVCIPGIDRQCVAIFQCAGCKDFTCEQFGDVYCGACYEDVGKCCMYECSLCQEMICNECAIMCTNCNETIGDCCLKLCEVCDNAPICRRCIQWCDTCHASRCPEHDIKFVEGWIAFIGPYSNCEVCR